jgi:membrane-bound lytic murein transglycosylase D
MKNYSTTLNVAIILLLAMGCSHPAEQLEPVVTPSDVAVEEQPAEDIEFIPKGSSPEEIDDALTAVEEVAEKPVLEEVNVGDEISHTTTEGIPLEINADVERWLDFFTQRDRERFSRFLERGSRYKTMINAVLKEQGIPTELYYQAMIESGFATHATSTASAVGIWQFIPGTGRRYGLRIDQYVDERRDPMRATIAAAMYLKDLHNVFQNWYLAMAAYNAGEGRILGAIMRSGTRDFWEMVKKRSLPSETMNYIPKFLAATTIGHNLSRYGFEDITPEIPPQLVAVNVPSPVKLADIARITGVPLEILNEYNPNIRRGITPPGQETYRMWVPVDFQDRVNSKQIQLSAVRLRNLAPATSIVSNSKSTSQTHRVKAGENLATISKKYNVSITALKKMNGLRSNRIYSGMNIKVAMSKSQRSKAEAAASVENTTVKYRVKRGDNLHKIAKKFNTSIPEIKKLNNLRKGTVAVGQILKVTDGKG